VDTESSEGSKKSGLRTNTLISGRGFPKNIEFINDTRIYYAGDNCIRRVADVARRSVREGEWMGMIRWGG
jgi:hypothetical protein